MSKQGIWDCRVDSYSNCISVFKFQSVFCQLHIPVNKMSGNGLSIAHLQVSKTTDPHFLNLLMCLKLQRPTIWMHGLLSLSHRLSV